MIRKAEIRDPEAADCLYYEGVLRKDQVPDEQVCVLHIPVISPAARGKGYGRPFIRFSEKISIQRITNRDLEEYR